ncbi:hypothetical protein FOA52_003025 [Chlamydomonas sp. UWO 241]|nr:hypothetical protein FOA52_003025 [Chlamydomonas sp. UWO 241]
MLGRRLAAARWGGLESASLYARCVATDAAPSTSSSASVSAPDDDGLDVVNMDSATLQSLASLIYTRSELFTAYLSRPEAEVAESLQQVISRLDAPRRALIMARLAAVSEARQAPLILGWLAAGVKAGLRDHMGASSHGGGGMGMVAAAEDGPGAAPAPHAVLRRALVDMARVAAASHRGAGGPGSAANEATLLEWLLSPRAPMRWEQLLRAPDAEALLAAGSANDATLSLAVQLLGLGSEELRPQHGALSAALGELSDRSMRAAGAAAGVAPGAPLPLDLLTSAASKGDGGKVPGELASAVAGLALARHVAAATCLSLPPDAQLVSRLLRTSPFHVLDAGAAACLDVVTPQLLEQAAAQLAASPALDAHRLLASLAAADPASAQGSPEPAIAAALAAAAPDSAAGRLSSALREWRLACMAAGVPAVLACATKDEVRGLGDADAVAVSAAARTLSARADALVALVPGAQPAGPSSATPPPGLEALRSLPQEHRLAVAWALRAPPAARRGADALASDFHSASLRAHRDADAAGQRRDALVAAFELEGAVAQLDLVRDRALVPFGAWGEGAEGAEGTEGGGEDGGGSAPRLPREADLAAAAAGKAGGRGGGGGGSEAHDLFDAVLGGSPTASMGGEAGVLSAFEALMAGVDGQEEVGAGLHLGLGGGAGGPDGGGALGGSLGEWFTSARPAVNRLPPPMLRLLARFLPCRIAASARDAGDARARARALLHAVQLALRAADAAGAPGPPGTPPSPYWLSADYSPPAGGALPSPSASASPPGGGGGVATVLPSGAISPVDADACAALLADAGCADQFGEWLRADALLAHGGRAGAELLRPPSPWDTLEGTHLASDLERYLMMRHAPELSLGIEFGAAPAAWGAPGPSEAEFLDAARGALGEHLAACGHALLGDAEWAAYKAHALAEFSVLREAHESALLEAGHSGRHDTRADAAALTAALEASLPTGSPLAEQARRYLQTLNANSSWSYAQRAAAVERLAELSAHFAAQQGGGGDGGAATERGSPFAPLFAGRAGAQLAPALPAARAHDAPPPPPPKAAAAAAPAAAAKSGGKKRK